MANKSLLARFASLVIGSIIVYVCVVLTWHAYWEFTSAVMIALSLALIVAVLMAFYFYLRPMVQVLKALDCGIDALNDDDFSLTIQEQSFRELNSLIRIYNELATVLRTERMDIFQRELLLDTVIQSTPVALVLTNAKGIVVYSNLSARDFFKQKKGLKGGNITELLQHLPAALRDATEQKFNGLVNDYQNEDAVIVNVNCREFQLNGRTHQLYLYKNMTHEMSRKETDMWKKVIRLISHELNNSLAPISSLTRSAKKIAQSPEHFDMLDDVLDTIGRRSSHLHDFISQYANFARMPKPKIVTNALRPFFNSIGQIVEINCQINCQAEYANFDAIQIEQVIINLVKNAKESGSKPEHLGINVTQESQLLMISVFDRGAGMSDSQLQQALLPFYSTKQNGTGIGLALCNEIVANHGGRLQLYNRNNGGLCVTFSLALVESEVTSASRSDNMVVN